jgi:putative sigma-54 modulation protein
MQLTISGQHTDITDALRQYVSEKFERIIRHFDHVTNTNVVLRVEKARHHAEATINGAGAALHANAEAEDMYAAIDALIGKLDHQVRRHKEKSRDHHRNGGALKNQEHA